MFYLLFAHMDEVVYSVNSSYGEPTKPKEHDHGYKNPA
jgi:hypothetical protein